MFTLSDKCVAFFTGLRPQIWGAFIDRFNIPNIAEFYGSTEGNSNISKLILICDRNILQIKHINSQEIGKDINYSK